MESEHTVAGSQQQEEKNEQSNCPKESSIAVKELPAKMEVEEESPAVVLNDLIGKVEEAVKLVPPSPKATLQSHDNAKQIEPQASRHLSGNPSAGIVSEGIDISTSATTENTSESQVAQAPAVDNTKSIEASSHVKPEETPKEAAKEDDPASNQPQQKYQQDEYTGVYKPVKDILTMQELKKEHGDLQKLPNVAFYCKRRRVSYDKLRLDEIQQQYNTNWRWMESSHDYIQWMFPNHYRSRFNYNSCALTIEQAEIFRRSREIGERMIKSFEQFLMFMGVQVHIANAHYEVVDQKRLYELLVENTHNHLRLRRILACLSVTGFRLLALLLIHILRKEIAENPELTVKKRYSWATPLSETCKKEWEIYGDGDNLNDALTNCFVESPAVFFVVNPALDYKALLERFPFCRPQMK